MLEQLSKTLSSNYTIDGVQSCQNAQPLISAIALKNQSPLPLLGVDFCDPTKNWFEAVEKAIMAGAKHFAFPANIDKLKDIGTALIYFSKERDSLFLTLQINAEDLRTRSLEDIVDSCLNVLGITHLESLIIDIAGIPSLSALPSQLEKVGGFKAKSIGFANCTNDQLKKLDELLKDSFEGIQLTMIPNCILRNVEAYAQQGIPACVKVDFEHNSELSKLKEDPCVKTLSTKHASSGESIILKWLLLKKIPLLTTLSSLIDQKALAEIAKINLSEADKIILEKLIYEN